VFFIAPVHTMLLFSKTAIQDSWLGYIFRFVAEGPGAQLFMLLMGISFALSSYKSNSVLLRRALTIFILGYLLNVLKFGMPFLFGLMPENLLQFLEVRNDRGGMMKLFLTGDILQFAGTALSVLVVCRKLLAYRFLYFLFAVAICFVSPVVWDLHSRQFFINTFLELLGGNEPRVFFPVFPWLVYPVAGVYAGYLIKSGTRLKIPKLWIVSILLCAAGIIGFYFINRPVKTSFYRTYPVDSFFHLLIVAVWLAAWQLASKWIPFNKCFDFLCWLSRHITLIYFIQWLFIFWLVPVFGFQQIGFLWTVVLIVLVQVNVLGLVYIIEKIRSG